MDNLDKLKNYEKILKQVIKWERNDIQVLIDEKRDLERIIEMAKQIEVKVELGDLKENKHFDIKDARERIGILKGLLGVVKTEFESEEAENER